MFEKKDSRAERLQKIRKTAAAEMERKNTFLATMQTRIEEATERAKAAEAAMNAAESSADLDEFIKTSAEKDAALKFAETMKDRLNNTKPTPEQLQKKAEILADVNAIRSESVQQLEDYLNEVTVKLSGMLKEADEMTENARDAYKDYCETINSREMSVITLPSNAPGIGAYTNAVKRFKDFNENPISGSHNIFSRSEQSEEKVRRLPLFSSSIIPAVSVLLQ